MQKTRLTLIVLAGCVAVAILIAALQEASASATVPSHPMTKNTEVKITVEEKVALGKALFFDTDLSEPAGQSCASCHDPKTGFSNPDKSTPTSRGAVKGLYADRNAPTIAYAMYSPEFYFDGNDYIGGHFLDGRADTLESQAGGPPLNRLEMGNHNETSYVAKVAKAPYSREIKHIYGEDVFKDPKKSMEAIADALATYERSAELTPFSSKFDAYQKRDVNLTAQELQGLILFNTKAKCNICHPSSPEDITTAPALFSDFTYHNLGVPKNPKNRFYTLSSSYNPEGKNFVDTGLARNPRVIAEGRVSQNRGKFKVPTLRNIELTAPYMHNGVFSTLQEVVSFYNTRDVATSKWKPSEVSENIERDFVGNLHLTKKEEEAIVAFLKTLTDGYQPKPN